MPSKKIISPFTIERDRKRAERAAEGAIAMAEHEQREAATRANMARLRAERLAREAFSSNAAQNGSQNLATELSNDLRLED